MPVWLIPVLKSILPHVGTIISAAVPVFTRKSADAAANQAALLQQQITELQTAASDNAAHIKELAVQLQHAAEALEAGTSVAEKNYRQARLLGIASFVISITALCAVLYLLFTR